MSRSGSATHDLEVPAGRLVLARQSRSWKVGSAVALASAAAVLAAMFVAPGQRLSVNSRNRGLSATQLVSAQTQTVDVSRLNRLEDGRLAWIAYCAFRPAVLTAAKLAFSGASN